MSPQLLRALLAEVWALMRPRRGVLALAFVLMAMSRAAGLFLPVSTRFFIDDVIGQRRVEWLLPLVLGVLGATTIQGLSGYALVQLVSKSAQKLIAEMRVKVQAHVGRLPVAFHDATRAGELVSRIMNDVECFKNLIGTGLVELAGRAADRELRLRGDAAAQRAGHAADGRWRSAPSGSSSTAP